MTTYTDGTVIEVVKDWPGGYPFTAGERFVLNYNGKWLPINSLEVHGEWSITCSDNQSLFIEVEDNRKFAHLAARDSGDENTWEGMILTVTQKDDREIVFRDVRVDSISVDGDTLTFEGNDTRNTPITHVLNVSHYSTVSE